MKIINRGDVEFTEIGVFLDQELVALRAQRLCGEIFLNLT